MRVRVYETCMRACVSVCMTVVSNLADDAPLVYDLVPEVQRFYNQSQNFIITF